MKLLLSSSSPVYSADLIAALKALVSGLTPARPKPWKLCHIATAGLAGRPDGDRSWMSEPWIVEEERQLRLHGFACDSINVGGLQDHSLAERLAGFDVVYIQGGNTFYLLDQLRRSGADKIIRDLVTGNHVVYCGISAGSIVACPDIAVAGWSPGEPQRGRADGSRRTGPDTLHPLTALRAKGCDPDRGPAAPASPLPDAGGRAGLGRRWRASVPY